MMELRSAPGDVLDRVAKKGEAFVIERNGREMACLVPLAMFMPDIQATRLAQEFDQLHARNEIYRCSITDERELELHFREQGPEKDMLITIHLPHGYPNACPKVYVDPLPAPCPHRWQDGSLCLFGAMELWNPGQHDIQQVLHLARRWLSHFATWQSKGRWGEDKDNA